MHVLQIHQFHHLFVMLFMFIIVFIHNMFLICVRFHHFPHVHQFLSETPVLFCKASAHVVLPNCLHNYFLLAKSGDCTIVAIQSMRCSSYSDYHFPKNGPILASILFIFVISSLQFQSYKLKKRRWLLFLVFKPGSAGW